ncbi:hypothetical protein N7510_009086 [Penicillium lagena]|uniref:uncharacterized protein n=1 Tax=Penicillium lagena TaxID=94218 RepID=UPI0025405A58|nr:uncharacterized protein N7510_009086 [Penicillium lagena]KAJ5606305.1 hypothetical protein N7510_009086 [Penicillium lagena]
MSNMEWGLESPRKGFDSWGEDNKPQSVETVGWRPSATGRENAMPGAYASLSGGESGRVSPVQLSTGAHTGDGKASDMEIRCRYCNEPGHFARNCNNPMRCFNCNNPGHEKADCTKPPKSMACFNCGQEGHTKVDCSNPRVFQGTCNICKQEGHPAALCPEKPPTVCRNCQTEGHKTQDCTNPRKFDLNLVADKVPTEAWALMKQASNERDLEEFRTALSIYSKAVPAATFVDIEKKMRDDNFNIYFIALQKEVGDVISLIDLQGKLGCTYSVGFFYGPKPQRATLRDRWPENEELNLEHLADAGLPFDRMVPKCLNCGEMGHISKWCKEERVVVEHIEIKCANCNATGHRVRDCTEKRRSKFGCRNCGSELHDADNCPEPNTVECRRCNQIGHFAKDCHTKEARTCRNCDSEGHIARDCPTKEARTCRNCGSEDHIARECDKPRDPSTMTCRNCDEVGHMSRDCTKKKDWSRVKCNQCGEMGHTIRHCPQAPEQQPTSISVGAGDNWNSGTATDSAFLTEPATDQGGVW